MAKAAVTRSIRDDHQKNFLKIFNSLTGKHSRWEIWEDFVTLTAIEISNSTDKVNAPERTKMYQTIVSKYSAKEREGMAEMLGEVIMGMEQNPDQDFLGSLYMMCELGNDHAGQFFTPYDVCRCMAEMMNLLFEPKGEPAKIEKSDIKPANLQKSIKNEPKAPENEPLNETKTGQLTFF